MTTTLKLGVSYEMLGLITPFILIGGGIPCLNVDNMQHMIPTFMLD
jgi:hypothetical protein